MWWKKLNPLFQFSKHYFFTNTRKGTHGNIDFLVLYIIAIWLNTWHIEFRSIWIPGIKPICPGATLRDIILSGSVVIYISKMSRCHFDQFTKHVQQKEISVASQEIIIALHGLVLSTSKSVVPVVTNIFFLKRNCIWNIFSFSAFIVSAPKTLFFTCIVRGSMCNTLDLFLR